MPRYAELASGRAMVLRGAACCLLPLGCNLGKLSGRPGDQPSLQPHTGRKLSQARAPRPTVQPEERLPQAPPHLPEGARVVGRDLCFVYLCSPST